MAPPRTTRIIDPNPLLQELSGKLDDVLTVLAQIAQALANDTTAPQPQWGQALVTTTGSPVIIGSAEVSMATVQALVANAGIVVVGTGSVSQTTGHELQPGQAVSVSVTNLSQLSVNGQAGDGVCWLAA